MPLSSGVEAEARAHGAEPTGPRPVLSRGSGKGGAFGTAGLGLRLTAAQRWPGPRFLVPLLGWSSRRAEGPRCLHKRGLQWEAAVIIPDAG